MPATDARRTGIRRALPVLILSADALLFIALIYKTIELSLLALDHVVSQAPSLAGAAVCLAAALGMFVAQGGERWFPSRERLWDQLLGTIAPVAIVLRLFLAPARKGFSGAWIPLEWHKVPANLDLMASIAHDETVIAAMLLLFLGYAFIHRGRVVKALAYVLLITWAEVNTVFAAQMPAAHKVSGYFVAFASPPLFALAFSMIGYPRWAMRATMAGAFGTLIFWHYAGVLPFHTVKTPVERRPGYTRIYPALGEVADFPLPYMRELVLSPDDRFLYTCFGPSSGIVRIDLASAQAHVIGVHGLSRYLSLDAARNEIWTLDWDSGDLLTFSGDPFARTRIVNILEGDRIAPWSFALAPDRIYVTFHEHPILAEYDRESARFLRAIDMKQLGLTRFNAGLLKVTRDESDGMLYAELGMTDTRNHFLIVKVDPVTLSVVETADLPEGGLDMLILPGRDRLVAASFFSNRLYEYQLHPLRLVRTLVGPLNSRNLAWDPKRELLVALAFLPGELWAIDYKSGIPLKREVVGHKAQSLLVDPAHDRLLVGSDLGIHAVDLSTWLAAPSEDFPPPKDLPGCTAAGGFFKPDDLPVAIKWLKGDPDAGCESGEGRPADSIDGGERSHEPEKPPPDPAPFVKWLRGDADAAAGCRREGNEPPPPEGPSDPPAVIKWLKGDGGCDSKEPERSDSPPRPEVTPPPEKAGSTP